MKKAFANLLAVIGVIGAVVLVVLTIRYGVVNTARGNAELYQWRLEHAVRP